MSLGYEVGIADRDEERKLLAGDAGATIRNRRIILLSDRLKPGARTDIVLLHEVSHLFQGDLGYLLNGEPATSRLELERDAWARAERFLDSLRLRMNREFFATVRSKALGASTTRGY